MLNEKTSGFIHEDKIYLNPDMINSNVAVHEYTHLWDKYIQNTNPELWEKGKAVFKNTSLWKQVISDPAYSDISGNDDLVLSECHARICGNLAQNVLEKIAWEDDKKISDWSNVARVYFPIDDLQPDSKNVILKSSIVNVPAKYSRKNNKISFKKPDNNQEDNMSSQEENITKFSRNINAEESKTGLSDDGIIRKRPEQFEEADRDEMDHTPLNYVVQKLEKAGIEVSTDIEEFHRILESGIRSPEIPKKNSGRGGKSIFYIRQ